ncbi:hypothetical protein QOT17_001986 [Balamuthia mandrillaris]
MKELQNSKVPQCLFQRIQRLERKGRTKTGPEAVQFVGAPTLNLHILQILHKCTTMGGCIHGCRTLYERLLVLQQTMMETLKMQDEAIALVDKLEERNRKQRKWL